MLQSTPVSFSSSFHASAALSVALPRFSTRQVEVLDVVEAVFLREGIRGVRMGQLADEAGCSRSTLYELAPSKEDLLLLVLDRMMRRIMRGAAEEIALAKDPLSRVRVMLESGALGFATLGPTFIDAVRHHPPARLLFDRRIGEGRDVLEALIDEAIAAGQFRPVTARVVAEAMFAVVLRFTDPEFARSAKVSSTAGMAELIDVLLDGLRPR